MFDFAWPWLLLCLPLPWLIRAFAPAVRQQGVELSTPLYSELHNLQNTQHTGLAHWRSRTTIYILIWLLLLLACARPQLHGDLQERPTTGRDLLIAMDVSSSMLYSDMVLDSNSVSRLEFIKYWLGDFISQRTGDRLGLILFGSQAYLQAPLTYDHHSIRTWVKDAQPGIAGNTTSMGDAIGLAIKRLRMHPADHRVLILVTDGANTSGVISPLAAAELAARYQIKIYTVGIGSNQANTLHELIDTASLELDEQALKDIAQATAGQYFHVTDSNDLARIQHSISLLEPNTSYQAPRRNSQELYSWPLAAALLLSMLLVAHRVYRSYRDVPREQEHN